MSNCLSLKHANGGACLQKQIFSHFLRVFKIRFPKILYKFTVSMPFSHQARSIFFSNSHITKSRTATSTTPQNGGYGHKILLSPQQQVCFITLVLRTVFTCIQYMYGRGLVVHHRNLAINDVQDGLLHSKREIILFSHTKIKLDGAPEWLELALQTSQLGFSICPGVPDLCQDLLKDCNT